MVLWPAVTLLGFLVLTALVIGLGTSSTARY
jgi:multisubunit Na+/H+ antiporter MnhC subunit